MVVPPGTTTYLRYLDLEDAVLRFVVHVGSLSEARANASDLGLPIVMDNDEELRITLNPLDGLVICLRQPG